MNVCSSLCALLHKCEVCTVWGCCDVHLPLVVFSARVERSGLSAPTLSHSTSGTHILSDKERGRQGRREEEEVKVKKGQ